MSNSIYNEVKLNIKSLLVSSPKCITVKELISDYEKIILSKIPFRELGYETVLSMLLAMEDAVEVHGNDNEAILRPVVDNNNRHIREMVMNSKHKLRKKSQRISSNRSDSDHSYDRKQQPQQQQEQQPQQKKEAQLKQPEQTQQQQQKQHSRQKQWQQQQMANYNVINNDMQRMAMWNRMNSWEHRLFNPLQCNKAVHVFNNYQQQHQWPCFHTMMCLRQQQQQQQIEQYWQQQYKLNFACTLWQQQTYHNDKIAAQRQQQQRSNSIDNRNCNEQQQQRLHRNQPLKQLQQQDRNVNKPEQQLSRGNSSDSEKQQQQQTHNDKDQQQQPNCIETNKNERERQRQSNRNGNNDKETHTQQQQQQQQQQNQHKKEQQQLDHNKKDGNKRRQQQSNLKRNIFEQQQQSRGKNPLSFPDEDLVVASTPDEEQSIIPSMWPFPNDADQNAEEAVPDFATDVWVHYLDFPDDVMKFMQKIDCLNLIDNIQLNDVILVYVSELHSPYKMWLQLASSIEGLSAVVYDMQDFYNKLTNSKWCIPKVCIQPGQVCAAKYHGYWHRGEIIANIVNDKAGVFFVDFGTVSYVHVNDLKCLLKEFARVPKQCIRAYLTHICPVKNHWDRAASDFLLQLTKKELLSAEIVEIDKNNQALGIKLSRRRIKNIPETIKINHELIIAKFAKIDLEWLKYDKIQDKKPRKMHPSENFPTFEMLEEGQFPNLIQLDILASRHIEYEGTFETSVIRPNMELRDALKIDFPLILTNPFVIDILRAKIEDF